MRFPTVIPASHPAAFVLQASVVAAWGIPPQYSIYAHRVRFQLASGTVAVIATAGPLEFTEELLSAVRRGDTTQLRSDSVLASLALLRIYLDELSPHRTWPEALDLARTHSISVRDAAYLELALRLTLPLATTDPALTQAASAAGVSIFTP